VGEKYSISLYAQVRGNTLKNNGEDEWIWNDEETQVYTMKLAYKRLYNLNRGEEGCTYDIF